MSVSDTRPVASNGHRDLGPPAYLLERGFPPETILEVGWRVEQLGSTNARKYGLPAEAARAEVWVIPYPHRNGNVAFERIRLIDDADLERFKGGKYRQPGGRSLALYDPYGALARPLDALLLVEGEANAVATHVMDPELSVLGLPGQLALTDDMAEQLGHVPLVFVWIDRHDPGAEPNAARIAERLAAAGVEEVRVLPATAGLDANDALRELGLERAQSTLTELLDTAGPLVGKTADDEWPPLPAFAAPPFPLDALPQAVGRFVEAVALETQTPPDLAAVAVLGALSAAALGAAVQVDCGSWKEELALYILAVMRSGDRKSAVLRSVVAPLHKLEREWREEAAGPVREQRTRQEALQARKQKLVRKAGEHDAIEERAAAEEELTEIAAQLDAIGEPVMPRLLADDATPEALGGLLSRHGQMAVLAAEAPLVDNLIGRYDAKGSANLHLVCHAYNGEYTSVDRRGRDPEQLDRPLLAILLAVQPHVLHALIGHPLARAQGLVGRFAYVLPESTLGRRRVDAPATPRELHDEWEKVVRRVNTPVCADRTDTTGCVGSVGKTELQIRVLSLSPSAKRLLDGLRSAHEPRLAEDGDLFPVADWIARHAGRVARIAGLLHLAQHRLDAPISEETMRCALRIGEYLFAHSWAALTEPDEAARRSLLWLARREEKTVSQRDLQRGPLGGRGTADQAHGLAQALIAAGALRPLKSDRPPRPTGGRPPSPTYSINPNLGSGSA